MEDQRMEREDQIIQRNEENSEKVNWIWGKGMTLGKRILVTGFVLTSAPVVVPPLMVISALGFACSVPYGVFLASYACAEKLMSTLLPNPATTPVEDSGMQEEEDEKYGREGGYVDESVEKNGYEEDVDDKIAGIGGGKDEEEEIQAVIVTIEGEDQQNGSNVREAGATPFEVTDVSVELVQAGDDKDNKELMMETQELIDQIMDEVKADEVAAETVTQTTDANGQVVVETRTVDQEIKENGEKGIVVKEIRTVESGPIVSEEITITSVADTSGLDLTDDTNAEGNKLSSSVATKTVDSSENNVVPSENGSKITSNKELYSEEQIWKKINAMRTIVGYTAARHGTCIEELKSLYVFTGVEPPASFKDSSDLVEVNDKLRFLMSIVGVK